MGRGEDLSCTVLAAFANPDSINASSNTKEDLRSEEGGVGNFSLLHMASGHCELKKLSLEGEQHAVLSAK